MTDEWEDVISYHVLHLIKRLTVALRSNVDLRLWLYSRFMMILMGVLI